MSVSKWKVVYRGRMCGVGRGQADRGRAVRAEGSRRGGDVWDTGAVYDKFNTETADGTTSKDKPTADREGIE